ncbi:DUF2867 domain-containing protein [Undibacterium sp. Jales W-56]|uniref:DUF2867 domain-containing protein n=1 Tax=Undibacterium sp. Jales W-56 TaxID=2897325 RepID=UPI0021D35C26|nr:DUF2867 domain-containing protein [Undibacterium sp. Jales W-56]MCU6434325.1 DUF2867 domain-containing protein [Undibacterium sp. Jales W-56]
MISQTTVPEASNIADYAIDSDFQHAFAMSVGAYKKSALDLYLDLIAKTPAWIDVLITLRNKMLRLSGSKNLGNFRGIERRRKIYKVGDKLGMFSILAMSEQEVILGDCDRHLDVRVSVFKSDENGTAVVSTVAHIHNLTGKMYLFFVVPAHKKIVPALLKKWTNADTRSRRFNRATDRGN